MRNEIVLLSCCAVTALTFAANDDGSQVLSKAKAKALTSLDSLPIQCREVTTVPGKAASLLPEGRRFELVWNDEFDGTELDDSKWSYRTNFWGRRAHWFAAPEDGCVEVRDGLAHLKIKKLPNGQFVSPQLQTGELLWDVPQLENPKGFWYVGRQSKPKFVHKYGYYECRCRLQRMPGWWSAFWMQTMMQGCCLDPALAGVEQDIMESFEPGEVIPAAFHLDGYGPNYRGFHIPADYDLDRKSKGRYTLAVDTENFHTYGLLWDQEGYSVYVDGRFRGRNTKAVSKVPEFVLLSTECKWFRNNRMTGKGVPELEAAAAAGDDFVVDYVRVYDCKGEDPSVTRMRPYPTPSRLMRLKTGPHVIGIVHFTVNTFTDREWGYGSEDPALFNPTAFDAEQIVKACRDGGIGGLVIVAKHHDGFCLWPTKTTDHNISKSPFRGGKGDYVKEMELACRKYGLEFGIYVSPWDRNNAAYATPAYVETYHRQIRELAGGAYGPLFEFWFDGANGGDGYYGGAWEKRKICKGYYRFDEVYAYLRAQQPGICLFGGGDGDLRWPGNESGVVPPESGCTRDDGAFRPFEADFPLRPGWFYHKSQDGFSRSGEFLMKIYLRTVGNAAIMDIGISPDARGLLTDEDVGCLRRFAELKKAFFEKEVKSPAEPFNLIELKEDVTRGERVDAWRLLLDGKEIAAGKKLGYSRLRVLDAPVAGRDLKLEVEGDAKADEIAIRLYAVDPELVRKVQASEEPKRPPSPFERCGVMMSRTRDTLKFMVKHPKATSALLLAPDVKNLDGTPVSFRLAWSTDGEKWTEDPTEHRLDNVAANPIPQRIELKAKTNVKYVKLTALRTLKEGADVTLARLDLLP